MSKIMINVEDGNYCGLCGFKKLVFMDNGYVCEICLQFRSVLETEKGSTKTYKCKACKENIENVEDFTAEEKKILNEPHGTD